MTYFLTILEKTIRFILHNMQPIIVILLLIAIVIANIAFLVRGDEFSEKFVPPWKKEERKQAKAEAKRKKLEEKERIKFWQG